MTRLVLATAFLLALAAPARADEGVVKDEPHLLFVPFPIPWLAVGALASLEDLRLGPTRSDVQLMGGYFWSHDQVFDPASTAPRPAPGTSGDPVVSNDWRALAEWDLHLSPGLTLGPAVLVHGGGIQPTGSYDADLAGGWSAQAGPVLRWRKLDEKAFPTQGSWADLAYSYGRYFGASQLDFQRGGLNVIRFFHLAPNQTLALRGTVQAGGPRLPWLDKLHAGGGDYVRGYAWWRFAGDRLAACGLEYRNLVVEDLGAPFGLKLPFTPGLALTAQVDAGRAWDSQVGLPVGWDPRVGGGVGFVLTLNRAPLGRLEVDVSPEGVVPVTALSTSF